MDNAAGKAVIEPTSVSTERIYRFDNASLVGNTEEEKLLNQEMRRDIASQIIRRIDATVRATRAKAQ
jgi:outer membrane lipopolysaccharide assembly protein LptE/RlpB